MLYQEILPITTKCLPASVVSNSSLSAIFWYSISVFSYLQWSVSFWFCCDSCPPDQNLWLAKAQLQRFRRRNFVTDFSLPKRFASENLLFTFQSNEDHRSDPSCSFLSLPSSYTSKQSASWLVFADHLSGSVETASPGCRSWTTSIARLCQQCWSRQECPGNWPVVWNFKQLS